MEINQKIEESWLEVLKEEFNKNYFKEIKKNLVKDIEVWETIYPPINLIFNAFNHTAFDNVKVVILWQDPYHGKWQAHWLCFSVQDLITPPPSLKNIFKELNSDLNINIPKNWNLEKWADKWVFLLNSILTVKSWQPASHSKIWWEIFTDSVIKTISEKKEGIVFLLWWAYAISKKHLIDTRKHYILETTHPSPFSAHRWFLWSKHFSKTNEILKKLGKEEINWEL